MAQKKSTATNQRKSASGSSSAKKGTAASRSARPIPKPQPQIPEEKEPLYSVIWSYSWGKALYLLLGILVLIGLDLLIAMNHYNLFFTVLGIEIIAAMLIGWLVCLIVDRRRQRDQADDAVAEEEE
ncbi:MAG: hypothetical protein K6E26_00575 [Clostridiales bacterium]|nr:hypothetical protein [Clostridiales bacterium]